MAFKMIDGDQRLVGCKCETLAHKEPDHHPADQSGSRSRRDRVDLADADIGFVQHLADQSRQDFNMGPCGDFRDHAAERAMRVVLTDHRLCKDLPVASNQRRSAVVAGRFKGQYQCHWSQPLPESLSLR